MLKKRNRHSHREGGGKGPRYERRRTSAHGGTSRMPFTNTYTHIDTYTHIHTSAPTLIEEAHKRNFFRGPGDHLGEGSHTIYRQRV